MKILGIPVLACAGLALAIGFGIHSYWQSPMGVFLYTPRDFCQGRTHAFSLSYVLTLAALTIAVAFLALMFAVISHLVRKPAAKTKLKELAREALISIAIFIAAIFATPLFELAMPLQKDPYCSRAAPDCGWAELSCRQTLVSAPVDS